MYFNIDVAAKDCDKYLQIMDLCQKTDVSVDIKFQTLFNGFYRLRQKNQSFYKAYFGLMEKLKNNTGVNFEEVLKDLYQETGEIHYSFASKLLHTIDSSSPILDRFIMKWMGFEIMGSDRKPDERIKYYVDCYNIIEKEYEQARDNCFIKSAIEEFDSKYPQYKGISYTKKIDSLLISKGTERTPSYLEYLKLIEKVQTIPGK